MPASFAMLRIVVFLNQFHKMIFGKVVENLIAGFLAFFIFHCFLFS